VLENVTLMVYAGVNTDVRRDRAMAALKRVGLRIAEQQTKSAFCGQQQRVAIARAIVNRRSYY